MKELINQIKYKRLPKEVLKLIDILNNGVVKSRGINIIISYSGRVLFTINQYGAIVPDIHSIIIYAFDITHYYMNDVIGYKELMTLAIKNSKYSERNIVW